jgi:hypothetical protein
MTSIVFHAGMPKVASTSVQHWLADHLPYLSGHGVQCVRIVRRRPDDPITVVPATAQNAVSQFVANDVKTRPAVAEQICAALAAHARVADADVLVVTCESYEVLFNAPGRQDVLRPFEELARAHTLRVPYYVRPQHAWLESAWLQWGFRNSLPPSEWIARQRQRVDYYDTWKVARVAAPHLSFEVRPFRPDLLEGGDVVHDFARVFLDLTDLPADERGPWSNRSLPLDAAILLRNAPAGMFWANQNDNKVFYPLKELISEWPAAPSTIEAASRYVLQRYAHATFEPGNQQLIRELGWKTDEFVPPVAETGEPGLEELDTLWASTMPEPEQQAVFAALQAMLASRPSASK